MDRGSVLRGKHFVLFCHCVDTGGPPRFGVFASKRLGGAVQRNRAKRRIRESYRRLKAEIQRPGVRVVFLARREAGTNPFSELMEEMREFMQRAGVLTPAEADPVEPNPGKAGEGT